MRILALIVLALGSLSARAEGELATNIQCDGTVNFTFTSAEGITKSGALLDVRAEGVLQTLLRAKVDVVESAEPRAVVNVTTVNERGLADEYSLRARIEFILGFGGQPLGGRIVITKYPLKSRGILRLQPVYSLANCRGQV